MIRAVLFDLDDTLIRSQTFTFFGEYLKILASHLSDFVSPAEFGETLLTSYETSLYTYAPTETLEERFLMQFSKATQAESSELRTAFADFYDNRYEELREMVSPVPIAKPLIQNLHNDGVLCVVATNPALPIAAIRQRMLWGGLDPDDPAFTFITSLESMRFGKPQPEYYEEILLRLGIAANEAVMVGNDMKNDMLPAQVCGLHTYYIDEKNLDGEGEGTLADFDRGFRAGEFKSTSPASVTPKTLLSRLATFPASIDHIRRSAPPALLDCRPGAREWSVRDIIFHLVDHETAEDQARLEKIVNEDNPFLSTNYDPWTNIHEYDDLTLEFGLDRFVELRSKTLGWLKSLDESVWSRPARSPIMGPTSFREMVQFITEHDRTHLRQMKESLAVAMALC